MPQDLHALALAAEKNLEQLATGMGQAGVDPQTVQAVTKMAEVTRKIVGILGQGQEAGPASPAPTAQQPATLDQAGAAMQGDLRAARAQK